VSDTGSLIASWRGCRDGNEGVQGSRIVPFFSKRPETELFFDMVSKLDSWIESKVSSVNLGEI